MNTLIIGSGFGIYGYLPSIIKISKNLYLKNKYQKIYLNRDFPKKYLSKIIWYSDIKLIINKVDYVVIAQNPKNQHSIIKKIIKTKRLKHLFLEKPISNTPKNSLFLVKKLKENKIKFSIGFLFKYLNWYKFISKRLTLNKKFNIIWEIKINNKNNLWKYDQSSGGGLLRFYAIHFIRLLFDFKITILNKKMIKKNQLHLNLSDKKKNTFDLIIKFSKKNKFLLNYNDKNFYQSVNPFLKVISKNKDPRVSLVKKYLDDILNGNETNYEYEKKFILFWKSLEK